MSKPYPPSILPDDGRVAYSIEEVGEMFALSKSTVQRRLKSGNFPSIRSVGRRLILRAGLLEYVQKAVEDERDKRAATARRSEASGHQALPSVDLPQKRGG